MLRPEVADAVRATCESILSARGVELVTFSLGRESVGQTLRLTVDRPEGTVSLDEIVEISEEVSKALDAGDPIPGRYTLEVASAGIERPLVRPADYRRSLTGQPLCDAARQLQARRRSSRHLCGDTSRSASRRLERCA